MRNILRKIIAQLTAEPSGKLAANNKWKIGFLLFCLTLLAFNLFLICFYPDETDHSNSGLIVAIMLLLNHVAFSFDFTPAIRAAMRIVALVFITLGLFYILVNINFTA
ncbi:MAG: hypothetical protein ACQES5_05240 [Thermodesulfobacteriota bacterium]